MFFSVHALSLLIFGSSLSAWAAINRHFPDSQAITQGEMSAREYAAYIEHLDALSTDDRQAQAYVDTHKGHSFFDMFRLSARCPAPMVQHPSHGRDGSKYACNLAALSRPCVIYSIGSEGNFMFEEAVSQFGCEIHTFDCYHRPANPPAYLVYHPWCIDGHDHERDNHFTLPTIMNMLGHHRIDFLKMDIEGAEYQSLPKLEDLHPDRRPAQIAVEIHPWGHHRNVETLRRTITLMKSLARMNYRLLSREDNMPAPCCSEFVYGIPERLPGGVSPYPYALTTLSVSPPLQSKHLIKLDSSAKDNGLVDDLAEE